MPHLTLEYSPNVTADSDFTALFRELHNVLAEAGGVRIENCKSRAYVARSFFIGAGGEESGFVHLEIALLEGRSSETRRAIGQEAGRTLVEWFQPPANELDLQVTVEVRDIERYLYFKFPEGTLTPL